MRVAEARSRKTPARRHTARCQEATIAHDPLVLITCEHAGKKVPVEFRALFRDQDALLDTHRGWDPGALLLAREMAAAFKAPLFYSETTRLLIDLNRSIGNPDLYSEFSRPLPVRTRREIVERHYRPHHEPIEVWLRDAMATGRRVIHVASHSFTPSLDGQIRTADIGFLYDPGRPGEVALTNHWIDALRAARPDLRLRRNYPYLGKSDGLTFRTRRVYPADRYVGIELEVNQQFVRTGGRPWPALRAALIDTLRTALQHESSASRAGRLSKAAPTARAPRPAKAAPTAHPREASSPAD
jgi:predicted N-formylglutamate amidohydrolase